MPMTAPSLKLADATGSVGVQLDSASGEVLLRYAPAGERFSFVAAMRTEQRELREKMNILCAGANMPTATRPAAMNRRISQLPERALIPARTVGQRIQRLLEWLVASKENTNYTYDLTALNL